jgi:hypothetical protein
MTTLEIAFDQGENCLTSFKYLVPIFDMYLIAKKKLLCAAVLQLGTRGIWPICEFLRHWFITRCFLVEAFLQEQLIALFACEW